MRFLSHKFIPFLVLIVIVAFINMHYEIFALNFQKSNDLENEEMSFRVMTYNVNASIEIEDIDTFKKGLIKEIENQNPDILCLQELSLSNFKKIQASLDSLFGYTDTMSIKKEPLRYWIYSKKPIKKFKRYKCTTDIDTTGFDISSKLEVEQIKKQMPIYSAEIEVEKGKWIIVFSCHLRSNAYSSACRSLGKESSWVNGIPTYYRNYKIGVKMRNFESDNIKYYLDSLSASNIPVILAGDMNTFGSSNCIQTLKGKYLEDAWWDGGIGFGITFDSWHLKLRLDHILYSTHFKLMDVFVPRAKFSDHRPLVADFIFN